MLVREPYAAEEAIDRVKILATARRNCVLLRASHTLETPDVNGRSERQ